MERGQIEAIWRKGGEDITTRGDRVLWGYFHADPAKVSWGSLHNPEVFVKIWYDVSGRIDVNYFHVSVPDITAYTDFGANGGYDRVDTTSLSDRYVRHFWLAGSTGSEVNQEDGLPAPGFDEQNNPLGYCATSELHIGAVIQTIEAGPIEAVWKLGGDAYTDRGDLVMWGRFYADPNDVTWGSSNNPELFVKIWFDVSGRVDVNFFHVSVPNIEVYSDLPTDNGYQQTGTTILADRYIRHEYNNVPVTSGSCQVTSADPHAAITEYEGPETCVNCHQIEAREMHGSVHYQQSGPTDYVTNIDGPAGERGPGEIGINTYCGTHENSPRFTCAGCHVGNGRFPKTPEVFRDLTPEAQFEELSNIDCLMCHQEVYKRYPDWTASGLGFETLEIVAPGTDGAPDPTLIPIVRDGVAGIPVLDPVTLDFQFLPAGSDTLPAEATIGPMPITTLAAAQSVHPPTTKSCLNCHAGAGGGDGTKRGDLSTLLTDAPLSLDMHMSSAGANLSCSDCHSDSGHRIRGRGLDLRPNDVAQRFTCESCHRQPHDDFDGRDGTKLDTHALRLACQSCHIPTYAKGVPTEVGRDWLAPHFSDKACNGRGGWLPREDKAGDLVPTYAWFDGTSEVYYLDERLDDVPTKVLNDGRDAYILGLPNGNVGSPGAKIYPMKEHISKLGLHHASNTLVPHSTFEFFRTGNFDAAVRSGMSQAAGMSATDSYDIVQVHTYQTLSHGVEVASNALECGACHSSLSTGSVRMNLVGALGYQLKAAETTVCTQCHELEEMEGFSAVHDQHVRDENIDCSLCHTFSRPARGLSDAIRTDDDSGGDSGSD